MTFNIIQYLQGSIVSVKELKEKDRFLIQEKVTNGGFIQVENLIQGGGKKK